MNKPSKRQTSIARHLRRQSTKAERILWNTLRNRQLDGFKFYRQFPIGHFIVDFLCRPLKLVIEVDGGVHVGKEEKDFIRQRSLEDNGYRVIRFTNDQVVNDLNQVAEEIRLVISTLK